jgi:N-acetylglutamate synthase-like GNAT family acetyltransferase
MTIMNDDTSTLKAHLKSLHANLANTSQVDEELKDLLSQLDGDIKALLERRAQQEEEEIDTYGLAERSQEITARFAAQHPKLEPALRELGTILSNMGI